jgi:hypothetical protein
VARWHPQDLERFSRSNELGSQGWRTIKIAFDNDNGYIIVELIVAKICCSVIDIAHELLS